MYSTCIFGDPYVWDCGKDPKDLHFLFISV